MASLVKDKGVPNKKTGKRGITRRILFKHRDGKRKPIRLGAIPLDQARGILGHINRLECCQFDGSAPPTATAEWLSDISDELRAKLVTHGLAAPKAEDLEAAAVKALTLGELIQTYKARPGWRKNKPKTRDNKLRAFTFALSRFGEGKPIDEFTAAETQDFYDWLLMPKAEGGAGQGIATANMIASITYTLFNFAMDAEWISRNPFKHLPRGARKGANANVGLADSLLVLDSMEGSEGKLLFGLARWGGLRTPSEPRELRWCDIDRERERMLVHSPKTERHEGHETRWVPIFPELAPLIQARYDDAEPGEVYVLPSLRHSVRSTATTKLNAGLRRAGVTPWARIWHSLRATRQTELAGCFAAHVVNAWMGNSAAVAGKHYLMVTEDDFARGATTTARHTSGQPGNVGKEQARQSAAG